MAEFVFFGVDCEKGEGVAIAKKYGVRAYPTFIAMNSKGEITDRWVGYGGPEAWSKDALAAAADPRTIPAKQAAFEKSPTAGLATSLANNAMGDGDYRGTVEYLRQGRELDSAHAGDFTQQILMAMYYGSRGDLFTFDEVDAEAKMAMAMPGATIEQKIDLALMVTDLAVASDQSDRAVPYLKQATRESAGNQDENLAQSLNRLAISNALLVDKDAEKAVGLFRAGFPEGWQEDAGQLNRFAWWCFEKNVNLEEAQELALKGVELAESDADRANILDTAAEICNKLGNCDEAVAHMKRAVELDPAKQYFQDQLVRFEKAVAEKDNG